MVTELMSIRYALVLFLAVTPLACSSSDNDTTNARKPNAPVEVESRNGNTIVCPADWSSQDEGDTWTLVSRDEQAVIMILTHRVKESGTIIEFQANVAARFDKADYRQAAWTKIIIGGTAAWKKYLTPRNKKVNPAWRIYLIESGECYHTILVRARAVAMEFNGDRYETIVRTFEGIESMSVDETKSDSASQ